jgi:hypothetical protein
MRLKCTLTKVIVLRFQWPVNQRLRKNFRRVRDPVTKPETGSAPAAKPPAKPGMPVRSSRCTRTRTDDAHMPALLGRHLIDKAIFLALEDILVLATGQRPFTR